MADRLTTLVAQVFGVSTVADSDSPDTIEQWTSMGHINLVVALEEEFKISIAPAESEDMLSVGLIRSILKEKGVTP